MIRQSCDRKQVILWNCCTTRKFCLVAACLLVGLPHSIARADLFVYEPFDYADNSDIIGQNGGIGWESGWTDPGGGTLQNGGTIDATGLAYNDGTNDLQVSGGHLIGNQQSNYRKIDVASLSVSHPDFIFENTTDFNPGPHLGKDGTTLWMSFIYRSPFEQPPGGGTKHWGGMKIADGDVNGDGMIATKGNAQADVGHISLDPNPNDPNDPTARGTLTPFDNRGDFGHSYSSDDLVDAAFSMKAHRGVFSGPVPGRPQINANPASFVLFRFDFRNDPSSVAGDPGMTYYETWPTGLEEADEIRLWINPSLTTLPDDADAAYMAFRGEVDTSAHSSWLGDKHMFADRFDFKIDKLAFDSSPSAAPFVFDELRLGTTFNDVTPTVSTGQDGDFDGDGDVDGNDFLKWQREDGTTANLTLWQNNYGAPPIAAASSQVPEPTTLALSLLGLLGVVTAQRKRIFQPIA